MRGCGFCAEAEERAAQGGGPYGLFPGGPPVGAAALGGPFPREHSGNIEQPFAF